MPLTGSKKSTIFALVAGGLAASVAVVVVLGLGESGSKKRVRLVAGPTAAPSAPIARPMDPEAAQLARAPEAAPGAPAVAPGIGTLAPAAPATPATPDVPRPPIGNPADPSLSTGVVSARMQPMGRVDLAAELRRSAATVSAGPPPPRVDRIEGALAEGDVRYATEVLGPLIRGCYAQRKNSSAAGRLTVRFKMVVSGGSGHVADAGITDDTVQDTTFRECVETALPRAQFPMPSNQGAMLVEYPLDLSPTGT
ncbi:MAG: AgmX/PglI C-terminal domain-containing protein [Deltaproteobacteria bacterium]|nr:AgmX/PglI C-terminal domain-containing protein [Deltaproteobacteria bacterium]